MWFLGNKIRLITPQSHELTAATYKVLLLNITEPNLLNLMNFCTEQTRDIDLYVASHGSDDHLDTWLITILTKMDVILASDTHEWPEIIQIHPRFVKYSTYGELLNELSE